MVGAKLAPGSVLVVLDSHIECTLGWLEPLLYEVARNKRIVISPHVDGIDHDKAQFRQVNKLALGGFDWSASSQTLELSWRVWMCGGRVALALCSRIAHMFKPMHAYRSSGSPHASSVGGRSQLT